MAELMQHVHPRHLWGTNVPKWLLSSKFGEASPAELAQLYSDLGFFALDTLDNLLMGLPELNADEMTAVIRVHAGSTIASEWLRSRNGGGRALSSGNGQTSGSGAMASSGRSNNSQGRRERAVEQPIAKEILDALAGIFGAEAVLDSRISGDRGGKYADIHTAVGKDAQAIKGDVQSDGKKEPDYTLSLAHEVKVASSPLAVRLVGVQQLSYAIRHFGFVRGENVYVPPPTAMSPYFSISTNVLEYGICRFTYSPDGLTMRYSERLQSERLEVFIAIGRILKFQAERSTQTRTVRYRVPVFVFDIPGCKNGTKPIGDKSRKRPADATEGQADADVPAGGDEPGAVGLVVGKCLGSGSTFVVWEASGPGFAGVMKVGRVDGAVDMEAHVLKLLSEVPGVPKVVREARFCNEPAIIVSPKGMNIVAGSVTRPAGMAMATQLLTTLAAVHARGVVCNDISPENVVLVTNPRSDSAVDVMERATPAYYIIDWGFSSPAYSTSFQPAVPCHPQFASPRLHTEYPIVRAPADDIVSLMLTLAYLMTGMLPWGSAGSGSRRNDGRERMKYAGAEIFGANLSVFARLYDLAMGLGRGHGTVIEYNGFIEMLTADMVD